MTAHADSSIPRIAFIRGINVGGHRKLPMADLRDLVTGLGADRVATYIQSGNAVIWAEGDLATRSDDDVEKRLADAIEERFGFRVPVLIRSLDEVAQALKRAEETFATELATGDADEVAKRVLVHFLAAEPTADAVEAFDTTHSPSDRAVVLGRELHVHYGNGQARSKITPDWIERTLGVSATGRNIRTLRAVIELAER